MLALSRTTKDPSASLPFQEAFGGHPRTVRSSEPTRLAPDTVEMSIYRGLAELPPFNPDLEGDGTPDAVTRSRARLQACDAVLISSPEYAHGVPGVVKNALGWVVGSGELVDKPIALINASARETRMGVAGGNVGGHVGARDIRRVDHGFA